MDKTTQRLETVYTDEGRAYYQAATAYWNAVAEHGETSDEAAAAGMHMAAELVNARNAGATHGELDLLRITARWMAHNGNA